MVKNAILINATSKESRAALIQQGILREFYVERKGDRGIVGNIYKAKVIRVLPGMQAAFVDIGQEKAAFLYVSDVYNQHEAYMMHLEHPDEWEDSLPQSRGKHRPTAPIEEQLKEGQEILVQVSKDPIGTKGARITSHITLPGRQLVHMPTFDHIGVSRRISNDAERERLRKIIETLRQPGTGYIVRTVSEGASENTLKRDIQYLSAIWKDILERFDKQKAPSLLYEELDLITRSARDLLTEEIEAMIIDDFEDWTRTKDFVKRFMPDQSHAIQFYNSEMPLFDAYGIEIEIARALDKKVWLKSGGYLVIEQTEALTAIDINTGKFIGKHSLEDTILQVNLEAVREIAYQLRLRNLGGLVIIDFIDMEKPEHREKVYQALEEALKQDKAKTSVLKISEFGIVEMTRKRVRESIVQTLCEPCPYCNGKGYIKSRKTMVYEILRHIQREIPHLPEEDINIIAHRDVAHMLYDEEHAAIEAIEQRSGKIIDIKAHPQFHIEQFEITGQD